MAVFIDIIVLSAYIIFVTKVLIVFLRKVIGLISSYTIK